MFLVGTAGAALGQIEGNFEKIGLVPEKNSLAVVVVEEFLNFTCPHCNNFRKLSKPVFAKYGTRVKLKNMPIIFRGQPDTPLRFYFVAEKAGRGPEVKEMIFNAGFLSGYNIGDPRVIGYLARSAGLWEMLQKEGNATWVTRKIQEAKRRANTVGVLGTPTIVLGNSIRLVPRTGMQSFVNNLDRILGQLLEKVD